MANLYDQLPIDMVAQFFYHVNKKIEQEKLSKSLNYEIELICKSVKKKGLSVTELEKYLFDTGTIQLAVGPRKQQEKVIHLV